MYSCIPQIFTGWVINIINVSHCSPRMGVERTPAPQERPRIHSAHPRVNTLAQLGSGAVSRARGRLYPQRARSGPARTLALSRSLSSRKRQRGSHFILRAKCKRKCGTSYFQSGKTVLFKILKDKACPRFCVFSLTPHGFFYLLMKVRKIKISKCQHACDC